MRSSIQDFSLANRIYAGATVTFYTVLVGVKTATKATLYSASVNGNIIVNPVHLDVDGKFSQAVYISEDVIATVSGLTIPDHDTGIIKLVPTSSSGSFVATMTGGATSPTTSINYSQVGATVVITGDLTGLTATSNSTSKTLTGTPSAIWPLVAQTIPILSKDNGGVFKAAIAVVGTDGVITVYPNFDDILWTASGVCAIKIIPAEYVIE
jgi:hypothetical protein